MGVFGTATVIMFHYSLTISYSSLSLQQEMGKMIGEQSLSNKQRSSALLVAAHQYQPELPAETDAIQSIAENLIQLRSHFYMLKNDDLDEHLCRTWKMHLQEVGSQFQQRIDFLDSLQADLSHDLDNFQKELNSELKSSKNLTEIPYELIHTECINYEFHEQCIRTFHEYVQPTRYSTQN